jgi:uncharacterized protein (DUF433 family)
MRAWSAWSRAGAHSWLSGTELTPHLIARGGSQAGGGRYQVAAVGALVVAVPRLGGHTECVTAEQREMISTDPQVMHGQAVLAGTRVPVSVILDCLAAGMTAEQIIAEYPAVTVAGIRAAAADALKQR